MGGPRLELFPCKVFLSTTYFPFDLAFAMTIHKAQGRTMDRVIIALSEHPIQICKFKWSALYVALSRVKASTHVRLLLAKSDRDRSTIKYITSLRKPPEIERYFSGFPTSNGSIWDADLAYNAACEKQSNSWHDSIRYSTKMINSTQKHLLTKWCHRDIYSDTTANSHWCALFRVGFVPKSCSVKASIRHLLRHAVEICTEMNAKHNSKNGWFLTGTIV